jgi:hypothetical protein
MLRMMKAAVAGEFGRPLAIEEVPIPTPGPGGVLIKAVSGGVCHTGAHAAGNWPIGPKLPFVPGLAWLHDPCGACEYCTTGWETLCEDQDREGRRTRRAQVDVDWFRGPAQVAGGHMERGWAVGMTSRRGSSMLVCVAIAFLLALPAAARVQLECSSWKRLSEDQKLQTIDRAIEDLISGSQGRGYTSINRTQTRRCLESCRNQMADDFDELCSRGMRTNLQALNNTFRSYVWSCVR